MDNSTFTHELTGVWYINNNMACRKNRNNDKTIVVPLTEEILEQINKQNIAEKELSKFLKTNNNDNKIIGKLWAFLEEYINYISYESKESLIFKMQEIELIDGMNENNVNFIHLLYTQLIQNDMESFENTLEQFFNFNLQNIKEMMSSDSSLFSSVLNITEFDFS